MLFGSYIDVIMLWYIELNGRYHTMVPLPNQYHPLLPPEVCSVSAGPGGGGEGYDMYTTTVSDT